jgi:small neutral amino acid transporter SnatA (MarC family)
MDIIVTITPLVWYEMITAVLVAAFAVQYIVEGIKQIYFTML